MFEQKVVKIKFAAFKNTPEENFKQMVTAHEKDGWEFVHINPSGVIGHGIPAYFELLFKREKIESEKAIG